MLSLVILELCRIVLSMMNRALRSRKPTDRLPTAFRVNNVTGHYQDMLRCTHYRLQAGTTSGVYYRIALGLTATRLRVVQI